MSASRLAIIRCVLSAAAVGAAGGVTQNSAIGPPQIESLDTCATINGESNSALNQVACSETDARCSDDKDGRECLWITSLEESGGASHVGPVSTRSWAGIIQAKVEKNAPGLIALPDLLALPYPPFGASSLTCPRCWVLLYHRQAAVDAGFPKGTTPAATAAIAGQWRPHCAAHLAYCEVSLGEGFREYSDAGYKPKMFLTAHLVLGFRTGQLLFQWSPAPQSLDSSVAACRQKVPRSMLREGRARGVARFLLLLTVCVKA